MSISVDGGSRKRSDSFPSTHRSHYGKMSPHFPSTRRLINFWKGERDGERWHLSPRLAMVFLYGFVRRLSVQEMQKGGGAGPLMVFGGLARKKKNGWHIHLLSVILQLYRWNPKLSPEDKGVPWLMGTLWTVPQNKSVKCPRNVFPWCWWCLYSHLEEIQISWHRLLNI